MSQHEKFAWSSLVASLLTWLFLTMRMTEGWMIVDASPRHMIATYVVVVLLMIAAHAVLAAVLGGAADRDERDLAIAARAERIEGLVVLVSVNVLILHALAEAAFAGHLVPSIDLGTLPVLFYALLTVLFLGHLTSQAVTIWLYRA